MNKQWMSSGFLRAAPVGEINQEKGVIKGVSVCTTGEAKGHGVNLDSEFIAAVTEMGNAKKQGLKARFGHPNMCSTALGTFIGRYKNFRVDGEQARADLFVSNEAKETPHGDLYSYVFGMAENESDMFGTSIVFTPGRVYRRDSKGNKVYPPSGDVSRADREEQRDEWNTAGPEEYIECDALHACDAVDEPAANEGLFSRFSQETIAGQITEFLDLHPQVWGAIEKNPSILEALGRYGDKVDEFTERYRAYRQHNGEVNAMTDHPTNSEQLEEEVTEPCATETLAASEELETPETPAEPVVEESLEVKTPAESEAVPELPAKELSEQPAPEAEVPTEALNREEFARIADEFGNDIAAQVMKEGGDYDDAVRLFADAMAAENKVLHERVAALESAGTGQPARVVAEQPKVRLFNTGK